jgi:hypothetical protein
MTMQTRKPRARRIPLDKPFGGMWRVTHPLSVTHVLSHLPHDGAVLLLKHHVLPRHVELMREAGC